MTQYGTLFSQTQTQPIAYVLPEAKQPTQSFDGKQQVRVAVVSIGSNQDAERFCSLIGRLDADETKSAIDDIAPTLSTDDSVYTIEYVQQLSPDVLLHAHLLLLFVDKDMDAKQTIASLMQELNLPLYKLLAKGQLIPTSLADIGGTQLGSLNRAQVLKILASLQDLHQRQRSYRLESLAPSLQQTRSYT